jgi:peptidoglycan hydrolase CwlO-like protein
VFPVCQDCAVLHDRLKELADEMYQVKKRCTRLQGELRHERQERAKLLKERKERQHYRNGQKRGRTRNG